MKKIILSLLLLSFSFCLTFSQTKENIVYKFDSCSISLLNKNRITYDVCFTLEKHQITFNKKFVFIDKIKYVVYSINNVEDCIEILVNKNLPSERTIEICTDSIGTFASLSATKKSKTIYWKNFY